jgi:capsular polysaccharide biosynthesis protein
MEAKVEEIYVAGRNVAGGLLTYELGEISSDPYNAGLIANMLRFKKKSKTQYFSCNEIIIDLRINSPNNWAHILTNHLPYVFVLADATGASWSELTLVLPANTKSHIVAAVALFGLRTHLTDESIAGFGISFEPTPWAGNRGARIDWVRTPQVFAALTAAGLQVESASPLPRRVFISRRDSRRLINEGEIVAKLATLGVETLYAEDLEPLDQFRLLARAELVIAIHGAALAPLLYRPPTAPSAAIVELFPVGHVTLVWQTLASQLGCHWVGVRGQIEPKHIKGGLYDLEKPFLSYSTDNFEIDPAALDRALEFIL